jgi:hypothetical protein
MHVRAGMLDAAERRVIVVTTFVAGCIALAPQEWVSAGVLLGSSGLLFLWDRRLTRREESAAKAAKAAQAAQPPPEAAADRDQSASAPG